MGLHAQLTQDGSHTAVPADSGSPAPSYRQTRPRELMRPMIPQPHMMALAPLDSWFKLLRRHSSLISPRFWPRTAAALLISAGSTIVTAPERAIFDLWINRRRQQHSTRSRLF